MGSSKKWVAPLMEINSNTPQPRPNERPSATRGAAAFAAGSVWQRRTDACCALLFFMCTFWFVYPLLLLLTVMSQHTRMLHVLQISAVLFK